MKDEHCEILNWIAGRSCMTPHFLGLEALVEGCIDQHSTTLGGEDEVAWLRTGVRIVRSPQGQQTFASTSPGLWSFIMPLLVVMG